jgi:hypothetical protein
MDQLKPEIYTPKKTNEQGYDKDGVLHDKCGTPDCCNQCDTAEEQMNNEESID